MCSMRAVLLVSVLALVAAHRENRTIQRVEQRHLVSCVVTVVQRHFPVGRTIQLSSTAADDHAKSVWMPSTVWNSGLCK